MASKNFYLTLAGCLSFTAAILHMVIIIGGPDWYRFLVPEKIWLKWPIKDYLGGLYTRY